MLNFIMWPLKWSSTLLLYTNPLIKYIVFVYFWWKVGRTCGIHGYLMTLDKSSKVECRFFNNVISYHKDKMLLGVIMLIGAKSSCNHCLFCVFHTKFFKKEFEFKNKLNFLHMIKSNILFYKSPKYEFVSLTFGPSKIM